MTAIDYATGDVAHLTEAEARRLTERIRAALDRVSSAWADLAERVAEAYQRRADLALGYGSWAEYAEAELKPAEGIAAEVRRQLVGVLSAEGMSNRAIAPVVGVSEPTARRDVARQVRHRDAPAPEPAEPERIDLVTGEVLDPEPEPHKVTGLDGKTYTRPEPKPQTDRRPPLRDGFRDAALDLDKIVHRFERLAGDDRLPRNRSEVARYANDLTRAIDALQRVADQLSN